MKKMGLLIALATVLTVGGVYAAWTYSDTTDITGTKNATVGLATATTTAEVGTITVSDQAMNFIIDQKDTNDYAAVLRHDGVSATSITCTFEPAAGAPAGWADDEVKFSYEITIDEGLYNGAPILVLDDNFNTGAEANADDDTWTITTAEILKAVSVNPSLALPTSAAYNDFKLNATMPSITVTFSATAE